MKRWFLVLAGLGVIALALLNLRPGDHLSPGVALLKSGEYEKALVELRPYAKRGDPVARNIIGRLYAFGLGVPRNHEAASEWFSCAGARDCTAGKSEFYVARDFTDGVGVDADDAEARYWMSASARQGYPPALEWMASQPRAPSE